MMGARGLVFAPLLLLLVTPVRTAACPAPQFPVGSLCFLPVAMPPLPFWGAQRECERAGGLLATLPDEAARAAAKEGLAGRAERSWWIGLLARDDSDLGGPPRWLDGSNVTEPDWAPGEPAGRCGLLSAEAVFRWVASEQCEQERPFLCQIDPRRALACPGTNATLRCGSANVVTVELATFGRHSPHICQLNASRQDGVGLDPGGSAEPDTSGGQIGADRQIQDACSVVNITDLIAGLCRGVQVCQAGADPALLGDPCPSMGNYLTVSYNCVEGVRVTAGEVFAVGDSVPIAIEWLLPDALGANLSCSVSLGDGRLIELSPLSGLLSEVSHRYALPGIFTLQVECSAAKWHVTAQHTLAVQQPIAGFSPAPCLKRPEQWQVEPECIVRFGHDFALPVSLLAGTNVSFQLLVRDVVLASWVAADGTEMQNVTLTAAMQQRVGEGEHVLRLLASNNVTAGGAPVQCPLLLALRRPVGELHATVTTPLVEVGQDMQVEVRVETGTPERVLFELLGVKGLVSEEREAANASHAIYRIPVSQQDVFSVRVTISDHFANVSAFAGNVTSVWGVVELSLVETLTVVTPPGRALFRATPRNRGHLPPDVSYSADFGDGRAGSGELRDLQIRHVYQKPGTYFAQFNLTNQVSAASLEVRVNVEPGEGADCGAVGVVITGGTRVRDDALPHVLWRPLTFRALVTANCSYTSSLRLLRYKWRLFSTETNEAVRLPISVETHHPLLTVPGRALSAGLYRVVFTAWMGGEGGGVEEEEDDHWEGGDGSEPPESAPGPGRAETFVLLRPGSLVAAIAGGTGRTVSSGLPVLLDASSSQDPDLGPTAAVGLIAPTRNPHALVATAALNFSWICDACDPSCLEAVSLSQPLLELPASCLVTGSELTVKVMVSAPGKPSAEAQQTLMVVPGAVPRVEIGCVSNCGTKLLPEQRLALHCMCHDCQGSVSYSWSLRQRVEQVQDAELVEQELDWVVVSTTGREQPYLVLLPGALSNHTGSGVVRVTVSSQSAVAVAEFAVEVVPPPRRGHCSVSPDTGWALSTRFSVLCSGFSSPEPPLVYCFSAEDGHTSLLLQCGAEPLLEDVLLPAGDAVHGGRLLLRVSVTDTLGAALSQLMSVTVGVAPMASTVGLEVGDPLALVHTENVGALAQLTHAVASVLNRPSGHEEGVEIPPQNAQLREQMIAALGKMPVRGAQSAQQLSEALSQITARPSELSQDARLRASAMLSSLSTSLQGPTTMTRDGEEGEQGTVGREQGARCLVAVASNILQVTTEMAHGGEDHDAGQVSGQALEALDTLQGVLLSQRVPGEGTMLLSMPALTLAMDRRSGDSMAGFAIGGSQSTDAAFTLPSMLPLPSAEPVDIQMVSFVSNPFAWSAEGGEVSGSVSSLSLLSAVDRLPILVQNLSQPIEITLPQAAPSELSRALVPGDGRLTLLQVNVTQDDLTMVVTVETGGHAMRFALFLSLGEEPTEQRHNLSVVVDTHGVEYTWLVEPEELLGAGTYYVGVQATHGADGNASFWVGTFATRCLYWHETQHRWAGDGCRVGPLTTATLTHCLCSHLTSFGAGFLVMPNVVDVSRTIELFATVSENPVVVSVVAAVLLLYLPIVVWARRKDRQDLAKVKVTVLADNDPLAQQRYLVTVYTGHRRGACTTAKVTLTLYGADAESEPHLLADERKPLLERGAVDSFLLTTAVPLGELQALRLWHDDSGMDPSWYVSRVVVQDLERDERFHFLCDAWLALDVGDGTLDRVFPAASSADLKQFRNLFYQKTTRDFRDGHLWFSVLSRPPRSPFTCVQRVSCCLSLLLCTMLTSIMFWGVPKGPPNAKLDLGGIEITWTEVMIGIESSILMFPINLLIVQFFRNVRPKPNRLSPRQPARAALPAKPIPPINKPGSVQELRRLARRMLRVLWPRDAPRVAAATTADEPDACRLTGLEMRTLTAPERSAAPLDQGTRERRGGSGDERWRALCGTDREVSRLLALVSDAARAPSLCDGDFYGAERRHLDSVCLALEKLPSPGEGVAADSGELCVRLQRVLHGLDAGRYGDVMREVDVLAGQLSRQDNAVMREVDVLPRRFDYRGDAMREVDVLPGRPGFTAPSAPGNLLLPHPGAPSRRGGLPWWCVYVGWALVVATSGVSAFFTMLYGLQYGRKRSLEWLLTTSISIFQSIFITQPLKVLGFAVFFALVLKKGDEVEDGEEQIEDAIADQRNRMLEPGAPRAERNHALYTPPSSTRVEQLKRQHEKEQRMYGLLREILVYMGFLWMLLLVAYGQRDPHAYHLNRALSTSLVGELGDGPVSLRDIFSWANATLIPSLFGERPGFLVGGTARLVGAVRLRQLRVATGRCSVAAPLAGASPPCRALYSWEDEDTRHYHGTHWAMQPPLNTTVRGDDSELLADVWRYRRQAESRSFPLWGRLAFYRGGGYVAELGTDRGHAQRLLQALFHSSWLDTRTRAVLLELTVYNANVNLFTTAAVVMETNGLGGFLPWVELHTLRLYQYTGSLHIFVMMAEIIYYLFIIYYMVVQAKAVRRLGWRYLHCRWSLLEVAIIVLSWVGLALFAKRLLLGQRDVALHLRNPNRFVSFYETALADSALGYVLALLVLLGTVKLWRLLRLNPKMCLLTGALARAGRDMASFLTVLLVALGAYALSCHVMFGRCLENYKSVWDSLQTLISLQLGAFNYREVMEVSPVLGPLLIGSCIIFMSFTLLNLFISVILVAFAEEQQLHEASEEEEIVSLLLAKIYSFCGIRKPTSTAT